MWRLRTPACLGRLIRGLIILTFVILSISGIRLVQQVSSLSDQIDRLIRVENDHSEWTATQISTELYRFQVVSFDHMNTLSTASDEQLRKDFDILYARMSQIKETHFHDIFGRYGRLDVLDKVIAQRDHMAAIIDQDKTISPEDAKHLIRDAQEALDVWQSVIHLVLREARGERIDIRQGAAAKIATARTSLIGSLGGLIAAGALIATLSKLRAQANHMAELANKDPLTGCLSRRGMEHVMNGINPTKLGEWSVAVVDLDGLKTINDTYGHAAGDKAIVEAGRILSSVVRERDYVGRVGGDEFWLALNASPEATESALMRAEEKLSKTPLDMDEIALRVSLSYGVEGCVSGVNWAKSFERADKTMYARKSAKRRVSA